MHFILEEKEKELIGNIKLSSVTAENNLVFCSVACDLVRSLRWQGSACLECKAHRCLGFYSLLWSNLFSVVLAAGAAQNTGFGKGPRGRELRGNMVAGVWKCSRSQETNMRLKLSLLLWRFRTKIHPQEEQSRAGLRLGIPANSPGSPCSQAPTSFYSPQPPSPFITCRVIHSQTRVAPCRLPGVSLPLVLVIPFLFPLCHLQRCWGTAGAARHRAQQVPQAEGSWAVLVALCLAAGHWALLTQTFLSPPGARPQGGCWTDVVDFSS